MSVLSSSRQEDHSVEFGHFSPHCLRERCLGGFEQWAERPGELTL